MRILDLNDYKGNMLDVIKLTSDQISEMIKDFTFTNLKEYKNDEIEKHNDFSRFIDIFYKYVYKHNTIPTQEEFFDIYMAENKVELNTMFKSHNWGVAEKLGLKHRIYKIYPSFIRDLHASFFLKEKITKYFDDKRIKVIYNRELDNKENIDILVAKDDKYFGLKLMTSTRNANKYKNEKFDRHNEPFENVEYIELPLSFNTCPKSGDIFLYGNDDYINVMNYIGWDK
jgi:hypothetical protein